MYDFGFLAPCPSSGLILQGDQDEIVAEPAVKKLAAKIAAQRGLDIDYRVLQGANHFFSNHVDQLIGHVEDYLRKHQPVLAEEVAV
jgi:alpha/beta superfamily hydrolase